MSIRYTCRHCHTEMGSIPFESAKELIERLHEMEAREGEQFVIQEDSGNWNVRCICEQCEASLRQFPDYYLLTKWLQ